MSLDSTTKLVSFSFNPYITILTFICAFLVFGVYKIVIRPKLRMQFYAKQGLPSIYFPLIGMYKDGIQALIKYGDAKYFIKHQSRTEPQRIIVSNFGSSAYMALYEPAIIKEFFQNTDNYMKDPVFLELYSPLLGKGLITSEGNEWKVQRKILSSAFHFGFLKSMLPSVQATAHQNFVDLRSGSMKDINIMDVYQKITGEVVGKVFFGEQLNQYSLDGKPLTMALAEIMVNVGVFSLSIEKHLLGGWFVQKGIFPKHKKLMQSMKDFRAVCSRIVEERKKQNLVRKEDENRTKDMLDLLLEYEGEEGKISDEGIIDQFVTFFMAGMDTTGHLLTMATYHLLKNPEYAQRLIEEVKQHYRDGKDVTIDDLNKLEYTMAFIKETLRTSTPIPGMVPRRILKDHKLKDIQMRKGDMVNVDFFYNSYNSTYFPEPDTFNPERFLEKEKVADAYAFTPFSAGPRNCIGQHLALIEARVILAEFLLMYDFSIKQDYELKMGFKFLYEPENPILLDLTPK